VISMGRCNTQLEPALHRKQKLKSLSRLNQPEHFPGEVLTEYSQTDRFSRGSIVGSTD